GAGPRLVAAHTADRQSPDAGCQCAQGIAAGRTLGLVTLRPGLQHAALVSQPGRRAGQRLANAGFRYRYLAGVAGHRPGRGTPDRPATQAGCSHGRWRDGHPVRPLDPAGAASALADGTLKARASSLLAPVSSAVIVFAAPWASPACAETCHRSRR